jgi:hypothetical protein
VERAALQALLSSRWGHVQQSSNSSRSTGCVEKGQRLHSLSKQRICFSQHVFRIQRETSCSRYRTQPFDYDPKDAPMCIDKLGLQATLEAEDMYHNHVIEAAVHSTWLQQ